MRIIRNLSDIVDWRLCIGCGACAYVCKKQLIRLVDVPNEGIRPQFDSTECGKCSECLQACPAYEADQRESANRPGIIKDVYAAFGPVLEIWEGHACDREIRFKGSSGGAITALSLFCLEREGMAGVLHVGQDSSRPMRNSTRMSVNREQLLQCVGSRYAPASVCDGFGLVEKAPSPCVVVGQPSEITALRKVVGVRPELGPKIGVTLSFFCAGSPSTEGTVELMKRYGVDPSKVENFRYRGFGWPGYFATQSKGQKEHADHLIYGEAWAFLQKFRAYSTHIFPDGSGEQADISCGDPWYRPVEPGEHGSSLIVVRTVTGRDLLARAVAAGYLSIKPATVGQLNVSQHNLTRKRGAVWGRLVAFKLLGVPTPRYLGYHLFANWLRLSIGEKYQSFFGTLKRIIQRGYYKRRISG